MSSSKLYLYLLVEVVKYGKIVIGHAHKRHKMGWPCLKSTMGKRYE